MSEKNNLDRSAERDKQAKMAGDHALVEEILTDAANKMAAKMKSHTEYMNAVNDELSIDELTKYIEKLTNEREAVNTQDGFAKLYLDDGANDGVMARIVEMGTSLPVNDIVAKQHTVYMDHLTGIISELDKKLSAKKVAAANEELISSAKEVAVKKAKDATDAKKAADAADAADADAKEVADAKEATDAAASPVPTILTNPTEDDDIFGAMDEVVNYTIAKGDLGRVVGGAPDGTTRSQMEEKVRKLGTEYEEKMASQSRRQSTIAEKQDLTSEIAMIVTKKKGLEAQLGTTPIGAYFPRRSILTEETNSSANTGLSIAYFLESNGTEYRMRDETEPWSIRGTTSGMVDPNDIGKLKRYVLGIILNAAFYQRVKSVTKPGSMNMNISTEVFSDTIKQSPPEMKWWSTPFATPAHKYRVYAVSNIMNDDGGIHRQTIKPYRESITLNDIRKNWKVFAADESAPTTSVKTTYILSLINADNNNQTQGAYPIYKDTVMNYLTMAPLEDNSKSKPTGAILVTGKGKGMISRRNRRGGGGGGGGRAHPATTALDHLALPSPSDKGENKSIGSIMGGQTRKNRNLRGGYRYSDLGMKGLTIAFTDAAPVKRATKKGTKKGKKGKKGSKKGSKKGKTGKTGKKGSKKGTRRR